MVRKTLLSGLLALQGLISSAQTKKPNIIFIYADDLGNAFIRMGKWKAIKNGLKKNPAAPLGTI